ncbi:Nickel/cobalt efflux system [Candidatus Desulfarcum epimagneticum]|uniref:Nickel/cobalt efflux system n=1 Tax=uncultured Desulfobacteraceae bacterium TaxID=218296 RepID=A0A484HF21_9BACT|nr:Nickel/cobalt efflux system [uncultured Desulfobacteraceae bacterium]
MKKIIIGLILLSIYTALSSVAHLAPAAENPFISKPEKRPALSAPSFFKNKFFMKINVWQKHLKEKMTSLVKKAKAEKSFLPIILLAVVAFAYGVLHAAGPGHGKAMALSYVFAKHPTYAQGLLLSNLMALFHGISGIVFVLVVRFVLNAGVVRNLENVSHITQIVSYSAITCLGLGIFFHGVYKLIKKEKPQKEQNKKGLAREYANPVVFALAVGVIPCPAVVITMLFALSMNLIGLGILLGIAIAIGMAFTISIVVMLAISGKTASIALISKNSRKIVIEYLIAIFAGLALTITGIMFLGAGFYPLFSGG